MQPRIRAPGPQRMHSRQRLHRKSLGLFSGSILYSHNLWHCSQSVHLSALNRRKKAETRLKSENIAPSGHSILHSIPSGTFGKSKLKVTNISYVLIEQFLSLPVFAARHPPKGVPRTVDDGRDLSEVSILSLLSYVAKLISDRIPSLSWKFNTEILSP